MHFSLNVVHGNWVYTIFLSDITRKIWNSKLNILWKICLCLLLIAAIVKAIAMFNQRFGENDIPPSYFFVAVICLIIGLNSGINLTNRWKNKYSNFNPFLNISFLTLIFSGLIIFSLYLLSLFIDKAIAGKYLLSICTNIYVQ